jgi:hypothetical protein
MRDISGELQGRAERLYQQISAEHARFDSLILQLRTKRNDSLVPLKAQLRLAHKLLEFTAWHDNLRAELAARIAAAETAETFIRGRARQAAEPAGSARSPAASAKA